MKKYEWSKQQSKTNAMSQCSTQYYNTHTGDVKPLKCDVGLCSSEFAQSSNLAHVHSHNGGKPFLRPYFV